MASPHEVLLASAVRTSTGRFLGALQPLTAPELGAVAVRAHLERDVVKERLTAAEQSAALAPLTPTLSLDDVAGYDLVVEAAVEQLPVKRELFAQLDRICPPATVLASNTSSSAITALAAATHRPSQVVGRHFFNPVPELALVEVVRGALTDERTCGLVQDVALRLGKTPVVVNDYPGFVANRVLMPMINEAIYCLMEGVADREAIGTVMQLGMNHPLGPLRLADLIGLDVCLDTLEVLHQGLGDPKFRPCPLLRRLVQAGQLGRKSGRGFYAYANEHQQFAIEVGRQEWSKRTRLAISSDCASRRYRAAGSSASSSSIRRAS